MVVPIPQSTNTTYSGRLPAGVSPRKKPEFRKPMAFVGICTTVPQLEETRSLSGLANMISHFPELYCYKQCRQVNPMEVLLISRLRRIASLQAVVLWFPLLYLQLLMASNPRAMSILLLQLHYVESLKSTSPLISWEYCVFNSHVHSFSSGGMVVQIGSTFHEASSLFLYSRQLFTPLFSLMEIKFFKNFLNISPPRC